MTVDNSNGDFSLSVRDKIWIYPKSTLTNVIVAPFSEIGDYSYSNSSSGAYELGLVRRIGPLGAVVDSETNEILEPALALGEIEVETEEVFGEDLLKDLKLGFAGFYKDPRANTSGVKGYYAEVNFRNNANYKSELFSVGAEVVESSK